MIFWMNHDGDCRAASGRASGSHKLRFIWPCKSDCQPIFPKFSLQWSQYFFLLSAVTHGTEVYGKPHHRKSFCHFSMLGKDHHYIWGNDLIIFHTLHNSLGTKEIPDCGNLVRPDWVGNLRWDNTESYEPFRWVNTEPSLPFRKANTDLSVQFRKANTDLSIQFRWGIGILIFQSARQESSWISQTIKPFADEPRHELLSGCIQ